MGASTDATCYLAAMDTTSPAASFGLYGSPSTRLAAAPDESVQLSPLVPGATALDALAPASLAGLTMLAPAGTLERRYDLAAALLALAADAPFTVLAPKDMGGSRLGDELAGFGCAFEESAKAHHRICRGRRPARLDAAAIESARAEGAPRRLADLGLWSQPGIFSWDRSDVGTSLLVEALPPLAGRGADFGCGIGVLAHAVLATPKVTRLDLVDIDRRAVEAARRNVDDPRVRFAWADIRLGTGLADLDFVVTNPPFHDGGTEDRNLGVAFLRRAAEALRAGGHLWLVANRHLPYEAALKPLFRRVTPKLETQGFKVIEAMK